MADIFTKKAALLPFAAILLACLLLVAGCGSGQTDEYDLNAEDQKTYRTADIDVGDIEVSECGATVMADGSINVALVAVNPNSEYLAKNVPVMVSVEDETGAKAALQVTVYQMYPNVPTACTGKDKAYAVEAPTQEPEGDKASAKDGGSEKGDTLLQGELTCTVQPVMSAVSWCKTNLTSTEVDGIFTKGNVEAKREGETINVSADVTGNVDYFDKILRSAAIDGALEATASAIFKDSAGQVLFGTMEKPMIFQKIDASGGSEVSSTVSLSVDDVPEDVEFASCELYVTPGI